MSKGVLIFFSRSFHIGKDTYKLSTPYSYIYPYSYFSVNTHEYPTHLPNFGGAVIVVPILKMNQLDTRDYRTCSEACIGCLVIESYRSHALQHVARTLSTTPVCLSLTQIDVDVQTRQWHWVINVASQLLAELFKLLCLATQEKK